MSFISKRVVIEFFNSNGFLNVKLNKINNCLEISKVQILLNFSKVILVAVVVLLVQIRSLSEKNSFDNANLNGAKEATVFAERVKMISRLGFEIAAVFNLALKIIKCKRMIKFINDARKLTLNEKNYEKFMKTCLSCFAVLTIYWVANCAMIFLLFINVNYVFSIVVFVSTIYLDAAGIVSVFAIKCIETYLVAHLFQINEDISDFFNGENLENLFIKFKKISKLFEDFDDAFGLQWTLNTSSITIYVTIFVCNGTYFKIFIVLIILII